MGPLLGEHPGLKNQMMTGLKSSLRSGNFEVKIRRTWPFFKQKSRDEVRPEIFGATAPSRMSFTEKISTVRMCVIYSNPNRDETKKNEVNFRRKCGNSGNGPHLPGEIDDFCQTGLLWYYYHNTNAVT